MLDLTVCRAFLVSCVFLFPREAEMQQRPTITPEFSSPLLVVEGQRVTLNWTFDLHGSAFRFVDFKIRGGALIVTKFSGSGTEIADIYKSRVTANVTDTFATVTFLSVNRTTDSKEYTFEVRSSAGETLSHMELIVQSPPSFNSFSPGQVVVEGNPATITLNCDAAGKPKPNVTWTKVFNNGSDSDILFVSTVGQFVINNNRNNAGTYRCKADNGIGSAINETISVTVHFKPENVHLTVNDSSICQGDAFSLNCSADDDGKPAIHTYSLSENDILLTTSNSSIVWTKTASAKGETVYRCKVNNTAGTANATATVTVNVRAVIQSLSNFTVTEGENKNLTCDFSGIPVPSATWTRVSDGSHTEGSTRKLVNVSRNDAGEYKCDASNLCGNDTKNTFLIVNFKPENVNLTVNDSSVCQGEAFSLTCSADGNPAVHILQLFENGTIVSNSSSSPLVWRESASTAGIFYYRCVANNSVGTAYATRTVHVNVRADIRALTNITVIEGEDQNLTCRATGTPMPIVSWTKVSTGNRTAGNLLQLVNISRNDAGEYKCDASNICGSDTKSAFLTVHFEPEDIQFTTNVTSNRACQNDVVFFNCSANANPPVALYQLFENDRLFSISSSGEFSERIMNSGNLTYKCVANNTVGTTSSQNVLITVNVPASIQTIEDKFITEQGNTSLFCNASGIPYPTVFWVNVRNGERTNHSVLQFTNINRSESGEYRCEASNECGTAVETVNLTVQYPPENVRLMTNATGNRACQNDVVSFTCSADAVPSAMSFQLFENNVPMERSSSGMWFKKLSDGGVFVYRCVANNSVGSTNSTVVSITVNVPPSIHPLQNKTITEGDTLNLSCNASGTRPLAFFWFRISSGERFNGSVLQLTNISRSQARDYRCEASNDCGSASEAQNINVQYPPENVRLMTNATGNRACQNDVVSFTCSADAVPSAISFQLFENNVPMGRSSSGMWFKKLSESGLFVYRCVASNSVGPTNSTDVPITVNVPAYIQPLQNKTITEGGNLNLSCNASGSLPLTVSWVRISSGQPFSGRVLQLKNISRSEARDYRCEASNDCANVSQAQSIDVQYKPEGVQLMTNATANKTCVNDSLKLTCSVGDANPRLTSFQLFRNSTGLEESDSGVWVKTLSNSGVFMYKCEANNSVGTAESSRVPITVNEAPTIASISDETVIVTNNLTLTCTASGVPAPTVSWVKVSSGQRTNESVLQFINIKRNEAGEYRCEATNECGNASRAVSVTVEFPLSIAPLRNKTVTKGQFVILFCDVSGQPTPSVSWTHLPSGSKFYNATWNVTITDERNLGIYRCEASNIYGNTSDIISVLFVGTRGFCEKACSNGRSCRPIGEFHSCLCSRGKKGTDCQSTEKLVKLVNAQFTFPLQYEDVYADLEDAKTMNLTKEIQDACFYEYKKQDKPLKSARVAKLSKGSVIADVELKFLSEVSESEIKELTIKMTNDGKLGNLSVTSAVVGPTLTPPITKEDCGAFFEGDDCKKAKPALLALTVVGALIVVGIIVAIVACKCHKKKRGEQAISNGVYMQPRNDPEGRGGTSDRNHANGGNYYGSENKGYEQERQDGTPMVTFSSNPAQTPGISVNDSSITKKAKPGEGTYADLGEFHQKAATPAPGSVKRPPAYEETPYAEITQFLQGPVDAKEETPQEEKDAAKKQDDTDDAAESVEPPSGLYPRIDETDNKQGPTNEEFVVSI